MRVGVANEALGPFLSRKNIVAIEAKQILFVEELVDTIRDIEKIHDGTSLRQDRDDCNRNGQVEAGHTFIMMTREYLAGHALPVIHCAVQLWLLP